MKAILISDHAKWCALMMKGIKKTEVRKGTALYKATKKLIDEYGYAEFYVYCTRENIRNKPLFVNTHIGNGKIIFKFRCYKVEEIEPRKYSVYAYPYTETLDDFDLVHKSCLLAKEIESYLQDKIGYAIHISDLEIFDKPKELSEFEYMKSYTNCDKCPHAKEHSCDSDGICCDILPLTKAPQSWQFIEV